MIGFVLVLTFLVMAGRSGRWSSRSPRSGSTCSPAGAAYGVLVLVFQGTWAEGLLGFRSNGAIVSWLPLFLFVVLFGLSMDYHVFVVSRIREARPGGHVQPRGGGRGHHRLGRRGDQRGGRDGRRCSRSSPR